MDVSYSLTNLVPSVPPLLCARVYAKIELHLFKTVLGEHAQIERGEYILPGEKSCVYTVILAQTKQKSSLI